jgi:hypothetical protein
MITLDVFLTQHAPLTAVDLLPDARLINVVIGDGALYGVVVEDIPVDATLTTVAAHYVAPTITTENGLVFDATQYVMLGPDSVTPE